MSASPATWHIGSSDVVEQFRAALEARDIVAPAHILGDGKLHRCDAVGKNGKGDTVYILPFDDFPAGGFQNHRDGVGWENWRADIGRAPTPAERLGLQRKAEITRAEHELDDARRHAEAVTWAQEIWIRAKGDSCAPHRPPASYSGRVAGPR